MTYNLSVKSHFDAAHYLRGYPGKCANQHGHSWKYSVEIVGDKLDELGMLIDFVVVKKAMKESIENYIDHEMINNLIPFDEENPTAENLAKWIYGQITRTFPSWDIGLKSVTVWESDECAVTYSGEPTKKDILDEHAKRFPGTI